jgi:hypothetical protein
MSKLTVADRVGGLLKREVPRSGINAHSHLGLCVLNYDDRDLAMGFSPSKGSYIISKD